MQTIPGTFQAQETGQPTGYRRRMVIYCRISDDREGRQNGTDRQERQCRALAAKNGDEIVAVFVDDDRSAYSGKKRHDYANMVQYLEDGNAEGVYALAPTRLYRRLYEPQTGQDALSFLEQVDRCRLHVETVKAGRYNLSTADGRRDAKRAALDAEYESDLIGERVRDAKADNLAGGEYRGGPRPFGYEDDGVTPRSLLCPSCAATGGFTVDRECGTCGTDAINAEGSEAFYAEGAHDAIVAGESLRSVCRDWKTKGVRTVPRRYKQEDGTKGEPEDREWQPSELRKMLLRPRNAGLIEHKGEIVGRAAWAPLVSEDRWRACKSVLEDPARRTTTGNEPVWLGSGLYECYCGETVRGSTGGTGRQAKERGKTFKAAYRCRTAKHVSRDPDSLDTYVQDLAVERLSRPDAMDLLLPPVKHGPDPGKLAAEANALRTKLDGFAADYADDLITRQQMLDGTALTRKRIAKIESQMAALAQKSVLSSLPLGTPQIAEQWPGYSLDRKRAIISALMTVTVNKARRGRPRGFVPGSGVGYFDADTIGIEWKDPGASPGA